MFVRDLAAGTTVAASRADGAERRAWATASRRCPSLDGDGDTVAFATESTNLGGPGGTSDVAVRELGDGGHDGVRVRWRRAAARDLRRRPPRRARQQREPRRRRPTRHRPTDVYVYDRDTLHVHASPAAPRARAASAATSPPAATPVAGEGPSISGNGDCVVFPSHRDEPRPRLERDRRAARVPADDRDAVPGHDGAGHDDRRRADRHDHDRDPVVLLQRDEARARRSPARSTAEPFGDCATVLGSPFAEGAAHRPGPRHGRRRATPTPTPAERAFTVDLPGHAAPAPRPAAARRPGPPTPGGGATAAPATPEDPREAQGAARRGRRRGARHARRDHEQRGHARRRPGRRLRVVGEDDAVLGPAQLGEGGDRAAARSARAHRRAARQHPAQAAVHAAEGHGHRRDHVRGQQRREPGRGAPAGRRREGARWCGR